MELHVKSPCCAADTNLGEVAAQVYKSPQPFVFDVTCAKCGESFSTKDTHEADYELHEAATLPEETAREVEEMKAALELLSGWILTWPKSEVQKEVWDEANKHIDE